jgi:hypothetical protein
MPRVSPNESLISEQSIGTIREGSFGGLCFGNGGLEVLGMAQNHGAELQRQGFEKVYFVIVGPSFKEGDLKKADGRVVGVSHPERQLAHSFGADAPGRGLHPRSEQVLARRF